MEDGIFFRNKQPKAKDIEECSKLKRKFKRKKEKKRVNESWKERVTEKYKKCIKCFRMRMRFEKD